MLNRLILQCHETIGSLAGSSSCCKIEQSAYSIDFEGENRMIEKKHPKTFEVKFVSPSEQKEFEEMDDRQVSADRRLINLGEDSFVLENDDKDKALLISEGVTLGRLEPVYYHYSGEFTDAKQSRAPTAYKVFVVKESSLYIEDSEGKKTLLEHGKMAFIKEGQKLWNGDKLLMTMPDRPQIKEPSSAELGKMEEQSTTPDFLVGIKENRMHKSSLSVDVIKSTNKNGEAIGRFSSLDLLPI